MTDETGEDKIEEIMDDFDSTINQLDKNQNEAETSDNREELSKEDLEEKFDGEYVASPTGDKQHLVRVDDSRTLCGTDLGEKEWPQSSEPGPFNPICKDCKSAFVGPAPPTNKMGIGSIDGLRNWFAERVDIESVEEASRNKPLTKAELQLVAEYIQSLESDDDHEL